VRWTLRLGDGTDESHVRMQAALVRVWPYVDELFQTTDIERRLLAAGYVLTCQALPVSDALTVDYDT
jgi:1,2-phenylacetyl-CoA epoxidase catalytic subunit